jgi:hypothetical protein
MATVGKFHFIPDASTVAQIQATRDSLARKRAARQSTASVFGMLEAVVVDKRVKPMDNPFVNTHIGDLE